MNRYREQAFDNEQTKQIEQLQSAQMAEEDEVALLQSLIEQARNRQGIKK